MKKDEAYLLMPSTLSNPARITIDEALSLLSLISKVYRVLNIITPHNTLLVLRLAFPRLHNFE
ncbi:MAG: hypothetical protein J7K21_03370 [Desulfurococcales archaeon]|nr:hypothetical protein [Desulfurococcales archaeon]